MFIFDSQLGTQTELTLITLSLDRSINSYNELP